MGWGQGRYLLALFAAVSLLVCYYSLQSWAPDDDYRPLSSSPQGSVQLPSPTAAPLGSVGKRATLQSLRTAAVAKAGDAVAHAVTTQPVGSSLIDFQGLWAKRNATHCVEKVQLVGNRPVGTYLCSYFEEAKKLHDGCLLSCGPHLKCEIKTMGSHGDLTTAEIVVNHHGPVPKQHKAYQTRLYYTGESNFSEPKKSTQAYWSSYDEVVSFHTDRLYHFTWTNRFKKEFLAIESGHKRWPVWESQIDAIVVMISRCGKGGRDHFVRTLAKHYPVHSLGKCARTHNPDELHKDCPKSASSRYVQKLCILSKYRFALAMDNSEERDYVSEKVYHGLISGTVTLYSGAPNVNEFLPTPQSVIHLNEFVRRQDSAAQMDQGFAKLGEFLRSVRPNSTAPEVRGLFSWRSTPSSWGAAFREHMDHLEPTCDLCHLAARKRCAAREG